MTPVEAVSPPIGQHRVCSNYNARRVMSLEQEVQKAVGDLLGRLRGSIESELTDTVKATQGERAVVSSVLAGVRRLDAGTTLIAILDSLGELIAAISGRAALLVIEEEGKIRLWKLVGFSPEISDVTSLTLTDADVSSLKEVIIKRQACLLFSSDRRDTISRGFSFAEVPEDRHALVVPVVIGDDVMVLVYADDVSAALPQPEPSWSEAVELLARYAGRRLEGLTVGRAVASIGESTANK